MKPREKKKKKKEQTFSGEQAKEKIGSRIHQRLSANLSLFGDYYKDIKKYIYKVECQIKSMLPYMIFPHQNLVFCLIFYLTEEVPLRTAGDGAFVEYILSARLQ